MPRQLLLLVLALPLLFSECRKDEDFNDDASFKLEFSADTLVFDTVFSTIGSVTLQFKAYNTSNASVNISSIKLVGGNASNYRINVDGVSGTQFQDVVIGPHDSIFIFAEVTVDPANMNNPFIIEDSIAFIVNGNEQFVQLIAWGQDAYFHYPDHPETQYLPAYSLVSGTWPSDKPHVVYGYAVVDEDSILNIQSGSKVYMHNDAVLWVYDGGSLKINGSLGNEVEFTSDRLDDYYKDLPGMWGKIWLSAGSVDNEINYAIIRNGRIGVQADTTGASSNPTLTISNTIIDNMSTACLYAQGSFVKAENCVFGNAGLYSVVLAIGGNYEFRHCTIGNYYDWDSRSTPALVLNNYYKDVYGVYQVRPLTAAYFGNCIIYGMVEDELLLDDYGSGSTFNYTFDHCMLRSTLSFGASFVNCLKNNDPLFMDPSIGDFSLQNTSPARDKGNVAATGTLILDILGNARIVGSAPDPGAFELQ